MKKENIFLILWIMLCIGITVYIFQPGQLNHDAVDQFNQARSGEYNDWHPPIMAWIWGWVDKVIPGALGMLVIQAILFWAGLGFFAALATHKTLPRLLIVSLGFFPPLFMLLGAVVKDVLMASFFLFGFGLVVWAGQKKSLAMLVLGSLFISLGMLTRHNAVLVVGPMFLYGGYVFSKIRPFQIMKISPPWSGFITGFIVFISVFLLGNIWIGSITTFKSHPVQQIMVHDLTGISLRLKTDYIPDYLSNTSEQPSMKDLRQIYSVRNVKNLYFPDFTNIHFKIITDPVLVDELSKTWLTVVVEHPRAYLEHRWNIFLAITGISHPKVCAPYYYEETVYKPRGFYGNSGGYYSQNVLIDQVFTWVEPLRNGLLFQNWFYFAFSAFVFLAAALTGLRTNSPDNHFVWLALLLGGGAVLYVLANLIVGVSCDFRYYHWNVSASLVGFILLMFQWWAKPASDG